MEVAADFKDLHFPGVKDDIYKIDPYGNIWSKKKSGLMISRKDKDGYLNVAENKLVYLLIDEVKKLKKEIYEIKQSM